MISALLGAILTGSVAVAPAPGVGSAALAAPDRLLVADEPRGPCHTQQPEPCSMLATALACEVTGPGRFVSGRVAS